MPVRKTGVIHRRIGERLTHCRPNCTTEQGKKIEEPENEDVEKQTGRKSKGTTMWAYRTRDAQIAKAARSNKKLLDVETRICPACGESFIPKTTQQSVCNIHCFSKQARRRGVEHRAVII
jgi:hypothetical protein